MPKVPEYNLKIKRIKIVKSQLEQEFPDVEKNASNLEEAKKWIIKMKQKQLIDKAKKRLGEDGYQRRLIDNLRR